MSNAAPAYPLTLVGAPRSGLVYLRDQVADYFVCNAVPASVAAVGLKYREFKLNQSMPANANRVVFIHGEFDGTPQTKPRKYGSISRATDNSASVGNPREVAHWDRPFTVSVWAPPRPGAREDEQASFTMVEDLLEEVVRAVQATAAAAVQWGDVTIGTVTADSSFGVELLAAAVMLSPLFDRTLEVVQATASISRIGA
jgi:hypothetical protein